MLTVGDKFPAFKLKAVVSDNINYAFIDLTETTYAGEWLVFFFWPKDFTFVCPTEIAEFANLNQDFKRRSAQLIGTSTDSEYVHLAWRQHKPELTGLPFPMASDIRRDLCAALGILDEEEGVAKRAVFIIDPTGIIRFTMVTDLKVGRNPSEVLRVLDALQTGELCPCNWEQGQDTLKVCNG